ncbi:MAG TPA: pitrilysin family protein [Candidatus Polarisedimenticolaceae bacterium]|nr:pitrilysin family protein [Candidatus Polarisedimenticolaceae bacterium]
MHRLRALIVMTAVAVLAARGIRAQDVKAFEQNLTVHKLPNGLTVLIYRRPVAPVFSFFTFADVGAAQEVPGITGLAHMFEHMAFKGTSVIGTKDFAGEKVALDKVDAAYHAYDAERRSASPDAAKLDSLKKAFKDAQDAADNYIEKNEFSTIVDRAGGVGMNASTNSDQTVYFYSLPANKVELWAYLESSRFYDPVFREFYKERDVVMEERRLRTESTPGGRLIEQFDATAYLAHPYKQPVVGYMSDLQSFSREDAVAFFKKYYVPADLTIAIVGDVKAEEVIPLVDTYFGRIPAGPKPDTLRTVEPKQTAEKSVTLVDPSQPVYMEAYHRPEDTHADDPVYDVIAGVLSSGRTSRLYRSLVRDKKIAAGAAAFNGLPGTKYPTLIVMRAVPTPGHTNQEVQAAIREQLTRLQNEPISDDELKSVKTRTRAALIRSLDDNEGIAQQLAFCQARYGDWHEMFKSVDKLDKVTKEDVMRVAKATFVPTNRTVGMIESADAAMAAK